MNPREDDAYPSRLGGSTRVLERYEPVVHGAGANGPLKESQLVQYESLGYAALPGVFGKDELAEIRREVDALGADPALALRPELILEPGGQAVRSIFRPHALHPFFEELVSDARLVGVAEQILGDEVYVHQARINLKPAFRGKEFFWHSDFETWHVEDGLTHMRALSISLALTDNNEFNGPLLVIPGSHRRFISCPGMTPENHHEMSLRRQEYGIPDDETLAHLVRDFGIHAPKVAAGSLVVFDCNIMHGSGSNISPWPRENLFVVYNSVQNPPQKPFSGQAPRPDYIAERSVAPIRKRYRKR
jgi:ectoine hydroxylase